MLATGGDSPGVKKTVASLPVNAKKSKPLKQELA